MLIQELLLIEEAMKSSTFTNLRAKIQAHFKSVHKRQRHSQTYSSNGYHDRYTEKSNSYGPLLDDAKFTFVEKLSDANVKAIMKKGVVITGKADHGNTHRKYLAGVKLTFVAEGDKVVITASAKETELSTITVPAENLVDTLNQLVDGPKKIICTTTYVSMGRGAQDHKEQVDPVFGIAK